MNTSIKIIILIATLTLGAVVISFILQDKSTIVIEDDVQGTVSEQPVLDEEEPLETTQISIPLASLDKPGDFGPFGCQQYINFHTVEIPQTQAVLSQAYNQLFSLPYDAIPGIEDKNIIASQDNLSFDSVSLENGTASLYLSGTVMGNHCADEVFRHQIEQTAFQFETVDSLQVFVNNEIFDWCILSDADPSESGCDINPRLWIKNKNSE